MYRPDVELDLGDLGIRPAKVEASVKDDGEFVTVHVKSVTVAIGPLHLVEVKCMLSRCAMIDIEETVEDMHRNRKASA